MSILVPSIGWSQPASSDNPLTISYASSAGRGDGAVSSHTFSSMNISAVPAEGLRRTIFVAIGARATANSRSISTVTLGGIAMEPMYSAINIVNGGSNSQHCYFFRREVSTGTSANISVTWNGSVNNPRAGVWAVYHENDVGIVDIPIKGTTSPFSGNFDMPKGGAALGYISSLGNGTARSFTWTGLQEDFDATPGSWESHSGASIKGPIASAQNPYPFTATASGAVITMPSVAFALKQYPPMTFMMIAGKYSIPAYGYASFGYGAGSWGHVSHEIMKNSTLANLTFNTINSNISGGDMRYTGNIVSLLSGKRIYVNGVPYAENFVEWTYSPENQATLGTWNNPLSIPQFVENEKYLIEVK